MISFGYRVHCPDLYRDTPLSFVIAVISFKALSEGFEWELKMTPTPRKFPRSITVKGTYETSGPDGTQRYDAEFSQEIPRY